MKSNKMSRTPSQQMLVKYLIYEKHNHSLVSMFNLGNNQNTPVKSKYQSMHNKPKQDLKYTTFMLNSRIHPKGLQYAIEKPRQKYHEPTTFVFKSKSGRANNVNNQSKPSIGQYQISFQAVEPHSYEATIYSKQSGTQTPYIYGSDSLEQDSVNEHQFRSTSFAKQLSRMQAHRYRSWAPDLYENEIKLREQDDQITPEELEKKINKQYSFYQDISRKYQTSGSSNIYSKQKNVRSLQHNSARFLQIKMKCVIIAQDYCI